MSKKLILTGIFVAGCVVVVSMKGEEPELSDINAEPTLEVEQKNKWDTDLGAEGDSVNETLNTVVTDYNALETKYSNQDRVMQQMQQEIDRLKKINNTPVINPNPQQNEKIDKLEALVQDLINQKEQGNSGATPPSIGGGDVNADLGLTDKQPSSILKSVGENLSIPVLSRPGETNQPVTTNVQLQAVGIDNTIWVQPTDAIITMDQNNNPVTSYPVSPMKDESTSLSSEAEDVAIDPNAITATPVYTIPKNSTLTNAVSMTALIGRVPSGGVLTNPFKFKFLIGEENIASNDLYIPNLKNMVVTGIAEGDYNLECVRGEITSATFTFHDGRVISQDGDLGWFSDEWGNPCIPGYYISNFTEYIATSGAMEGLSAFGSAIAQAQTTTTGTGDEQSVSITGDALKYAGGSALESSTTGAANWVADRQESAFDAVWIEAGERVVVHIDEQINIDYDTNGRKLFHSENLEVLTQ